MTTSIESLNPLTFPLHGSRLIEASAGTGKTFTIALLYLRLVLGEGKTADISFNAPLSPKDILVVTFTKMAAAELRDRIRARLVEAADYFKFPHLQKDKLLVELREDYAEDTWQECAFRLQMASENMDESSVSTIHSWCNRVLVEHSFNTRGLFNRELVTDTSELFNQVVQDYWRQHFYSLSPAEADIVLQELGDINAFTATLKQLIRPTVDGVSYQSEAIKAPESISAALAKTLAHQQRKQQLLEELVAQWQIEWPTIREHILDIRSSLSGTYFKGLKDSEIESTLTEFEDWLNGQSDIPKKARKYATGDFVFKQKAEYQEAADLRAFRLMADYNEYTNQELKPAKADIYAHAQQWVRQAFQQRLAQQAQMGFDDVLTELANALDPEQAGHQATQLASKLKQSFPIAMIDEFQDTDPTQYAIFDRIYQVESNPSDAGLFMIGDPKQSIYSFRGADINVYLAAREATTDRHYTLTTNYRSAKGVVAACNEFFGQAENFPEGTFQYQTDDGNPVPYIEVAANGKDEHLLIANEAVPPLTLWQFTHPKDDVIGFNKTTYNALAADTAASEITRWLNDAQQHTSGFFSNTDNSLKRPLAPKDIAILVRDGNEADAMKQALAKRQVASVYLSQRDSLFNSQEAQDMVFWLTACAEPKNESLVRAALGTYTMHLPLSQHAHWQQDDLAWDAEVSFFIDLHHIWQRQGVLVMVERLLAHYQLPGRLLQQQSDGERALTNVLHLAEWLEHASTQVDGMQALIRHLREHLEQRDEENVLRLESDAKRVKIITIHGSKGLEYPLVLLPFISNFKHIDGKTKTVNIRANQQQLINIGKHDDAIAFANRERLREDLRLLYVAMTRASHALWLGLAPVGTKTKVKIEGSAMGYILNGGKTVSSPEDFNQLISQLAENSHHIAAINAPEANSALLQQADDNHLEEARPAPNLSHLRNWWIASYSALKLAAAEDVLVEPDTATEDQLAELAQTEAANASQDTELPVGTDVMSQFPRGPQWGTFLHTLLEWAAVAENQGTYGFAVAANQNAQRDALILNRCQLRNIEEHAPALSQWLQDFLQQTWHSTGFALVDLAPEQVAVEMEFLMESHQVSAERLDALVRPHTIGKHTAPQLTPKTLNGMFKGFIDLVAEHDGKYYVIDWKSNHLGNNPDAYDQATMQQAIFEHRYDLQYCLYLLALHRQLKARLPNYDYDQHIGGAVYVFLRGWQHPESQGIFHHKPPRELIEAMDQLFAQSTEAAASC